MTTLIHITLGTQIMLAICCVAANERGVGVWSLINVVGLSVLTALE